VWHASNKEVTPTFFDQSYQTGPTWKEYLKETGADVEHLLWMVARGTAVWCGVCLKIEAYEITELGSDYLSVLHRACE